MSTVHFTCDKRQQGVIPEPTPSIKCVPNYFKKLAQTHDVGSPFGNGTAKRCVPILDAFSQGFIIPLWEDIIIVTKDGDINLYTHPSKSAGIGTHLGEQLADHPRWNLPYGKLLWKFLNPWIVTTDKNYSCLFTSPLNHLETRFKLMDGVVDTDTYYDRVNFPFIWTGGDGEFTLEKGTPLVQVIPFKREKYNLSTGLVDNIKAEKTSDNLGTLAKNAYRRLFWHKRKGTDAGGYD